MFEVRETPLPGCLELQPVIRSDQRGHFVKTFHAEFFRSRGLETEFREHFYSVSKKGVLRGLHFQRPPHDYNKLVYCSAGVVLDLVVDLRVDSQTYGRHYSTQISAKAGNALYIPKGIAHGFYAYSESAVHYSVSSDHSPDHDDGILWSSVGFEWPDYDPILSERDRRFPSFSDFESPFRI